MSRWAIVGGGLLGSSLALRLADEGESVTVFEAGQSIGGLASAWRLGPITWDRHYHVTLGSDRYTRGLLRRLDLESEMRWVNTTTGSWHDGELHSISNVFDFLTYPPLNLRDKARLAWTIVSGARERDWKLLEQIYVEDWLREKSGDRVFESFWLPLLEAKLGDAYRETSAAFIWATIQRLYSARSSGAKTEQFGYVPGGYARILETLAKAMRDAGVDIVTGSRVGSIIEGPHLVVGDRSEDFDRVVVTAVPQIAARLIDGLKDEERLKLESIRYQGIVCASVLTSKPLEGYYLTYLHGDVPFTGVVEMSAFVDPSEFGGRTLIYLPRYCPPSDPIFEDSDSSIRRRFLSGLETVYPQFDQDDVEAFEVSRVRRVFPVPTIGYSDHVPGFDTSVDGVHLVSSAQIVNGTLNVNETLELARRAGGHLLQAETRAPA
jgi:protoporphyrinogen oxidase